MVASKRIGVRAFFGLTTIHRVGMLACVLLCGALAQAAPSAAFVDSPVTQSDTDSRKVHFPVAVDVAAVNVTRQGLAASGAIMHDFDPPSARWLSGHRGIDFAAPAGEPVYSIVDGTVSFSGKVAGKPVVTVSLMDGTRVTHEPLESVVVVGTKVSAGDLLGHTASQSTAHCQDRCIHIGHVDGRDYLDPWRLMGDWVQIVLKPN